MRNLNNTFLYYLLLKGQCERSCRWDALSKDFEVPIILCSVNRLFLKLIEEYSHISLARPEQVFSRIFGAPLDSRSLVYCTRCERSGHVFKGPFTAEVHSCRGQQSLLTESLRNLPNTPAASGLTISYWSHILNTIGLFEQLLICVFLSYTLKISRKPASRPFPPSIIILKNHTALPSSSLISVPAIWNVF